MFFIQTEVSRFSGSTFSFFFFHKTLHHSNWILESVLLLFQNICDLTFRNVVSKAQIHKHIHKRTQEGNRE